MKKTITYLTILILLFNVIFTLNTVQAHDVELDPEGYISMPMFIFGDSGTIGISDSVDSPYEAYYQQVDLSSSLYEQIKEKNDEAQQYYEEESAKLSEEKANIDVLKTEYENISNDTTTTDQEKENARNAYQSAVDNYRAHVETFNSKIDEYNQAIQELTPSYVDNNWTQTDDGSFEIDTSKYVGEFQFVLWAKLVVGSEIYYDEQIYTTQGTKEITINLDKTTTTMEVGDTLKLTATTNSSENVTWSSNKTDIATVSSDGTVTAVSKGVATITATVGDKSATCTVTVTEIDSTGGTGEGTGNEDDEGSGNDSIDWTDFSNAKFELKKEGVSDAILEISNVSPKEGSSYYFCITSDSNKPNATSLTSEGRENLILLNYDENSKKLKSLDTDKLAGYIELNQDLYVSIVEKRYLEENVIIYGKKLERYEEPKYSDAFFATFMTSNDTQLVTLFTHGQENNRKIQIKVGKITDTSILQKIKNQDSSGFANLLSFAKSNNGIYDKILDADSDNHGYAIEYNKNLIDLNGLQNDEYYFLYIKTDDENGRYISQEAVTLAQAYANNEYWNLCFFGESDFKWADFGTVDPDGTTAPGIIPNAGLNTIIWMTAGVALVGVFSYKQYRKNNF